MKAKELEDVIERIENVEDDVCGSSKIIRS